MNSPSSRDDVLLVVQRIKRERVAAQAIIEQLRVAAAWDTSVPEPWRTAGFVQALNEAAPAELERDTARAMKLARLALSIVGSLADETYPDVILIQLEATAWKELANAHRYRSEYDSALRALSTADSLLARAPALGHDRAVARFARALVLSDKGDVDDAFTLLAECADEFEEYRDIRRTVQCLHLRGMLQQRQGQLRQAIDTYSRALRTLTEHEDTYTRASLLNNMGQAYGDLSEHNSAESALGEALELFQNMRAVCEIARTRWGLGRALLAAGRYAHARAAIASASEELRSLHLLEEAGLSGLDLADVLIALGDAEAAVRAVDDAVHQFRSAGLNSRTMFALNYLRDLLPTPKARAAVRHVRAFIAELREHPDQMFLRLPDRD